MGIHNGIYHQQYVNMIDKKRVKGLQVTEKQKKAPAYQEAASLLRPSSEYGPGIWENNE